jgi:hypothetical protein
MHECVSECVSACRSTCRCDWTTHKVDGKYKTYHRFVIYFTGREKINQFSRQILSRAGTSEYAQER